MFVYNDVKICFQWIHRFKYNCVVF